jgi:hypothetical protein
MPYQFVLTIGSLICAVVLQFDRRAAAWLRLLMLAFEAVSFLMPTTFAGQLTGIALQLVVSLVVLVRREASRL